MAADAEIVLKFKAEIEEALNQIKELQKALSEMKDSGGVFGGSTEESEHVSELQAQLSAYISKVQELKAAYDQISDAGDVVSEEDVSRFESMRDALAAYVAQVRDLANAYEALGSGSAINEDTIEAIERLQSSLGDVYKAYREAQGRSELFSDNARTDLEMLRDDIEDTIESLKKLAAAYSELNEAGGGEAKENAQIQALTLQAHEYSQALDEVKNAYFELKASGGAANEQALAQIKELSGELETEKKQINGLVDKILELQVENNKLKETTKETGKEIERTGEAGMRSYRSLRSIVSKFITDLARGKVNIQEMGTALKGLAYSTVVLGAIQLAMDGINAAAKALSSALGASAEAAEEAAERAQSALGAAEAAATRAAEEVVNLKKEMAAQAEHDALKQAIEEQTEGYREQLRIVQEKMATLQSEAELEAHQRAMRESADKHAYAMQKLELDIRLARKEITKEEYARAKAELDFNQKAQENANKLADAKAKQAKEAKAAAAYEREFAAAQAEADQLAADRGRYTSDSELKIQEKILEQRKAERDKISAQIDAAAAELRRLETDFSLDPVKNVEKIVKYNRLSKDVEHMQERLEDSTEILRKAEANTKAARESNAEYQRISSAMNDAQKNAEELRKKTEATKKAAQEARTAYSMLQETVSQQDAQSFELYGAQARLASAKQEQKAKKDAEKAGVKDARERKKLSAEIEKLTRKAAEAAGTTGDVKDDQRAVEAVNSFLDKNAEAVARYGLDMGRLLDVAGRLKDWQTAQGSLVDKLEARLAKLEQDVASGAQRSRNAAKNS